MKELWFFARPYDKPHSIVGFSDPEDPEENEDDEGGGDDIDDEEENTDD